MDTIQVTSAEFKKNFGELQAKAQREPITVTNHGKPRSVLMSAEKYQQLMQSYRRSLKVTELTDEELALIMASKVHPRHKHLDKELKG